MHHPLREVLAAAGALRDAERRTAAQPEIFQAGGRPQQRRPVGRVRYRAVDDPLDAGLLDHRHALHRAAQPGHQAFEVVGEQFTVRFPGRVTVRRPGLGEILVFVDADQPGLLFLANI